MFYFLATVIYYTTSYITFPLEPTVMVIMYFLLKTMTSHVSLYEC